MNNGSRSKAGLFLLEFTIMLLIFALASTVTLRLFAKSNEIQRTVTQVDAAVVYAQSAVEQLKACDGQDAALTAIFGSGQVVYLDAEFAAVGRDSAVYTARATLTKVDSAGGRYIEGALSIAPYAETGQAADPLYSLPFGIFYPAADGKGVA